MSILQKKRYFFSVGYLRLVVCLSTKCKQIICSNNFLEDSENEQTIIFATTFYRLSDLACIDRRNIGDSRIT